MNSNNLAVYANNPIQLKSLVNKFVTIRTKDKRTRNGWVKTIDPVSESVVLVSFEEDRPCKVEIVLGHAINFVEVVKQDSNDRSEQLIKFCEPEKKPEHTTEDLKLIKEKMKQWLVKNRFPVNEAKDGSLVVAGALTINPPFEPKNCICSNEIILGRIQDLMRSIPKDM